MAKPKKQSLDDLLPGMRAAFAETIWSTFPWIQSIWVKESKAQFQLFVQVADAQDDKEWDDFDYLVREVFESGERVFDKLEPGSKHKFKYSFQHGPRVPEDHGYRELMSDRVFEMIAKRHAP